MPFPYIMRRIIFFLLLISSINLFAKGNDILPESVTPLQISQLFVEQNKIDIKNLIDLVDKEEKIVFCINEYIQKQSKSYSKIVQNNLYDLIHNFDRIASRIYGKKQPVDEIPYEDKIEALARVQCEAYYALKVLK